MTASTSVLRPASLTPGSGWAPALAIMLGLGAIVGARLVAVRAGIDPLLIGAAFGSALAALALAGGAAKVRPSFTPTRIVAPMLLGSAVGMALVAAAVAGPAIAASAAVPGLGRPAAPFLPWALVTIVVATAEEGVLRGALFDRIGRVAGIVPAIAVTTLAFALLHVPLYGWHVVPLDLAVGLVLAGLRISTRGLAAPIAAHVVADLATWWL